MNSTASEKITVTKSYATETGYGTGDLTAKQYAALEKVARLSHGYTFELVRYSERAGASGSAATHVRVYREGDDAEYIALVGRDCAQYYDGEDATGQVVRRIAHRVYRTSVYFS